MQCNYRYGRWSCKLCHAQLGKGCRYETTIKPNPTQKHGLPFRSTFGLHLSVARSSNKCKTDYALRMTRHQVRRSTDAKDINSDECSISFGLYRACGRTCTLEKGHGPLHRPTFPRGIKSSCGRPGACQSKAVWIKAKCWIQLVLKSQGSIEKSFKVALSS